MFQNTVRMLQFLCKYFFLPTFCLSNRTPKITRILMLYQANVPTLDEVQFFKYGPANRLFSFESNLESNRSVYHASRNTACRPSVFCICDDDVLTTELRTGWVLV